MNPYSPDLIRVGDTLQITFSDTPVPVPVFDDKVKDSGVITLMLNQTFVVTNKTRGELETEIRARYVPDYYRNMTVTVQHQTQSRFYYVGGEVKSPGRQVYVGPITVTKAIQTAGDFTDFAKKTKVKLIRVDGRVQTVNCPKALVDPRLDPEVYPGDQITVPRRFW
jgi:polysaccharide export outer membrane protein